MVTVRGQTTMVAPMVTPMPDPLQVVPRRPVVPEMGIEPPGPAMKTCVPGPHSLRLKQELNDIQVRVTLHLCSCAHAFLYAREREREYCVCVCVCVRACQSSMGGCKR